jgi:hypothetical protein
LSVERDFSVEIQPVKRNLGGWCEIAAGVSQLGVEFCMGGYEGKT